MQHNRTGVKKSICAARKTAPENEKEAQRTFFLLRDLLFSLDLFLRLRKEMRVLFLLFLLFKAM